MRPQRSIKEFREWGMQIENIKNYCRDFKQDWVFCFSGDEGSGKSTIAVKTAMMLDPTFNIKTQIVNSLHDYSKLVKKFAEKPYKAIVFDEAVKCFYNREYGSRSNVILMKMFISNRSFQHFNILTIPSPFYLDKYIREWRIKTMVYTWIDKYNFNIRKFGVYNKRAYKSVIMGGQLARYQMMDNETFLRQYPPNYECMFSPLQNKNWEDYSDVKDKEQDKLIDESIRAAETMEVGNINSFGRSTEANIFVKWLSSNFGYTDEKEQIYINVRSEDAAIEAVTPHGTIKYLINKGIRAGNLQEVDKEKFFYSTGRTPGLGKCYRVYDDTSYTRDD